MSAPAQPPAPIPEITPEITRETAAQGRLIHFPISFFAVTMGLGGYTLALHAAGGPLGFTEICGLFFSIGLIVPAEDRRARAKIPDRPDTIAALHDALISEAHNGRSSDAGIGTAAAIRAGGGAEAAIPAFVAEYFTRGRPCLRASPLTRTHGWAVHADTAGRVALLDPDRPGCAALIVDPAMKKLRAMRNARA